jgi:hypothetical protein
MSMREWLWWFLSLLPHGEQAIDVLQRGDTWDKVKVTAGLTIAAIVAFGGAAEIITRLWKWRFRCMHRIL